MDRDTEEFETFLRQFRPCRPGPLPTRRRLAMPLAAAAVVLLGVSISLWVSWSGADTDDPQPTTALIESGTEQTVNPPADTLENTPALEFRPTLEFSGSPDRDQAFRPAGASARQGSRLRVGDDIQPPTKVFDVAPVYPDEAQAAGEQGIVILDIVIGEDGSVIEADVERSIPLLDQAALDAVWLWLFEPTVLDNGEPVEIEMYVTVNFTLSE